MAFQELQQTIDNWADSLTQSLVETRYWDIEKIKISMSAHLKSGMMECLKKQVWTFDQDLLALKDQYANGDPKERLKVGVRIAAVNQKRKHTNRLMSEIKNWDEYRLLKEWVVEKLGKDALHEFFDSLGPYRQEYYKPVYHKVA